MQATTSDKQTFIISSICFPKHFSKLPLPSVVPEDFAQSHMEALEKDKQEFKKLQKQAEESEELGIMDLDMEKEAGAMLGIENDAEVIAEDDSEDMEELDDEDILVIAAYNTPEISNVQCYVFQPAVPNLYLQHDGLVSEHCLAVEWMNFHPYNQEDQSANVCATATFDTFIEIWDMNVRTKNLPILTLGGEKGFEIKGQHKGGILSLSWHESHRHLLASASEDATVKIWDLASASCGMTLKHHKNVVHAVAWNPVDTQQILTCSFDGTACLVDPQDPEKPLRFQYGKGKQSEEIAWFDGNIFAVSTNTGHVLAFDKRNNKKPLWTFKPHKSECHSIHFSGKPGTSTLLATCGADYDMHLYDISKLNASLDQNNAQLDARLYTECKQTALFAIRFHDNFVAVGGQNLLDVTDLRSLESIRETYKDCFPIPDYNPEDFEGEEEEDMDDDAAEMEDEEY